MAYLIKQKFDLSELAERQSSKKVLLFEPEEYLAGLYALYLKGHDFEVYHCDVANKIHEAIGVFEPHVLVFNVDSKYAVEVLQALKFRFPNLSFVSTSFVGGEQVKELMSLGSLGHINRKFSRPQDLGVIIKSILS